MSLPEFRKNPRHVLDPAPVGHDNSPSVGAACRNPRSVYRYWNKLFIVSILMEKYIVYIIVCNHFLIRYIRNQVGRVSTQPECLSGFFNRAENDMEGGSHRCVVLGWAKGDAPVGHWVPDLNGQVSRQQAGLDSPSVAAKAGRRTPNSARQATEISAYGEEFGRW